MRRPAHVQMLLTDAFGSLGDISQFNRDFLSALNACSSLERVHALPRLITEPIEEVVPESSTATGRGQGRLCEAVAAAQLARRAGGPGDLWGTSTCCY